MIDRRRASTNPLPGGAAATEAAHSAAAENSVVWTLWLAYGAFYFCRTNISAAVPGMKASLGEGGLKTALKHIAPERITLNPDCSFAPGSAADVSLDEVYKKLKKVAAAERLREKYA